MTPRVYLAGLEFHGIKLGLDNIVALLEHADNPQTAYPSVHVAGTNGKGSVLAFLDAMLRAAGYRTGRFTSPHLLDVTERFLVDGIPISEADLDRHIERFRAISEANGIQTTYFEMVTAIAFEHFKEERVDLALIEVGMGGRFDATNVLTPVATAITPIDLDHMQYLGDTLEKIAGEKAGILKPGVPAVIGETRAPAYDVLIQRAMEIGAPVLTAGREFQCSRPFRNASFRFKSEAWSIDTDALGLPGDHQVLNAGMATALAQSIQSAFPRLTARAVQAGLEEARWPCRLERVLDSPPVIIDAAHNPAAFQAIANALPRGIVVLAVSNDKHAEEMVHIAERFAHQLLLAPYHGTRAMSPESLAAFVGETPFEICPSIDSAIDRAIPLASDQSPLIVVGSIFAAGEARRHLIERYGASPLRF